MYNGQNRGINVSPNRSGVRNAPGGMRINPNRNNNGNGMSMKQWVISQGGTGKVDRLHPLDAAGVKRRIGQTYFDPVTRVWKEDDGRPRGWSWIPPSAENPQGRWAMWCSGKCKKRSWFRTTIKCPCSGTRGNCFCKGCFGGAGC